MKKWDDFRLRRQDVLNKFILAKRKQKMAQEVLRQVFLNQFTIASSKIVGYYKEFRELQNAIAFIRLKFLLYFKKIMRRNRGFANKLKN